MAAISSASAETSGTPTMSMFLSNAKQFVQFQAVLRTKTLGIPAQARNTSSSGCQLCACCLQRALSWANQFAERARKIWHFSQGASNSLSTTHVSKPISWFHWQGHHLTRDMAWTSHSSRVNLSSQLCLPSDSQGNQFWRHGINTLGEPTIDNVPSASRGWSSHTANIAQ